MQVQRCVLLLVCTCTVVAIQVVPLVQVAGGEDHHGC